MNEKICIGIVNRNSPEMGDSVYEHLSVEGVDIFLLENGSSKDKISKYTTDHISESNGISWAVNFLCKKGIDLNYDYVWIAYNDVRFDDPAIFLEKSIEMFRKDKKLAVVTGNWPQVWNMGGEKRVPSDGIISFFDPLSFIVSCRFMKEVLNNKNLTPFWDSKNHVGHHNILGPAHSIYLSGHRMAVCQEGRMTEIDPVRTLASQKEREKASLSLRGYTESEWINSLGPKVSGEWLDRFFPFVEDLNVSVREKRNIIIRKICQIYASQKEKK